MNVAQQGRRRSFWSGRLLDLTVVLAIGLVGLFWAVLSPPAQNDDEPLHVNSVIRLMQGGGWPPPHSAPVLEAIGVATLEAGTPWRGIVWDGMPENTGPVAPEDRSVVSGMDAPLTREGSQLTDWMTQHPPTWYAITAGTLKVLGADGWRWDQLFLGARLVSLTFTTAAAAFILASVRRVTGSRAAGIIGTLAIFASAQFFNVLSLASSDSLAFFAGSGMLYFLSRALTAYPDGWKSRWFDTIGAGLFLGLGLLTKGTLLTAIPAVFIALLVAGLRGAGPWWRKLAPACAAMLVAFAMGGWYYVRNLLVNGEIQSSNSGTGRGAEAFDGYSLRDFATRAVWAVSRSFFESTKPYLDYPTWLVLTLLILVAVATVVVLVRGKNRLALLILAIYPACVAGLIIFHAWEVYWNIGRTPGLQGRYLFPAITVLCGVIGVAWAVCTSRLGPRSRACFAAVTGLMFLAIGAVGAWITFDYRWRSGRGWYEGWQAMAESGAVGPLAVLVIACLAVLAGVSAIVVAARRAYIEAGEQFSGVDDSRHEALPV